MPPKTVALVGAVCLTTGWLLASLLTPPVAKLQALPERAGSRAATAAEQPASSFSEQLHWRLQQAPVPPTSRRNPFVFAGRSRPLEPESPGRAAGEMPVETATSEPAVATPIFSVSGIGIAVTPDGEARTAVITDGDAVYIVKAGDSIRGFSVADVSENGVTIVDPSGVRTVLRFRN